MRSSARAERIGPADWREWRALRLEALQDTPIAFWDRYDEAVVRPDAHWQERLRRPGTYLLVRHGGAPVAMALGQHEPRGLTLGAVYVTPAARGQGVVGLLVAAVERWAAAEGGERLRLLVHEDNPAAQRAYSRLGFAPTGHRVPYPFEPGGEELEMDEPLAASRRTVGP